MLEKIVYPTLTAVFAALIMYFVTSISGNPYNELEITKTRVDIPALIIEEMSKDSKSKDSQTKKNQKDEAIIPGYFSSKNLSLYTIKNKGKKRLSNIEYKGKNATVFVLTEDEVVRKKGSEAFVLPDLLPGKEIRVMAVPERFSFDQDDVIFYKDDAFFSPKTRFIEGDIYDPLSYSIANIPLEHPFLSFMFVFISLFLWVAFAIEVVQEIRKAQKSKKEKTD